MFDINKPEIDFKLYKNKLCISVENLSDSPSKAVIFGSEMNLLSSNFGSDSSVKISINNGAGISYFQVVTHLNSKEIEIGYFRMMGETITKDLLEGRFIHFCSKEITGMQMQKPIYLKNYFSIHQFQSNIIEILEKYLITSDSQFEIELKPKEKLDFIFSYREIEYATKSSVQNGFDGIREKLHEPMEFLKLQKERREKKERFKKKFIRIITFGFFGKNK
jgi:hypothetical protein